MGTTDGAASSSRHQPAATAETVAAAGPASVKQAEVGATIAAPLRPAEWQRSTSTISRTVKAAVLPRPTVVDQRRMLVHEERMRYEHGQVLGEGGIGVVLGAQETDI